MAVHERARSLVVGPFGWAALTGVLAVFVLVELDDPCETTAALVPTVPG
jgi:hypothetical protein